MIQQLKILIKLLPSGFRFKTSIIGMVVMTVIGIVMTFCFPADGLGVIFIMMEPIWLSQTIISITVSDLVKSSTLNRAIQTSFLALSTFLSSGISYLLVILLDGINRRFHPFYTDGQCAMRCLVCCAITMVFALYISVCYKYFIVSSIVFFFGVEGVTMLSMEESFKLLEDFRKLFMGVSLPMATLLGFAAIFLASFLQYGITCLLYKKPLAKTAQCAGLRKQM